MPRAKYEIGESVSYVNYKNTGCIGVVREIDYLAPEKVFRYWVEPNNVLMNHFTWVLSPILETNIMCSMAHPNFESQIRPKYQHKKHPLMPQTFDNVIEMVSWENI